MKKNAWKVDNKTFKKQNTKTTLTLEDPQAFATSFPTPFVVLPAKATTDNGEGGNAYVLPIAMVSFY